MYQNIISLGEIFGRIENPFFRKILRVAYRFFKKKCRDNFIGVNGFRMTLDENDSLGLSLRPFEPETTELVKEKIKEGDCVADIGANIGYYTLLFSKLVGGGTVYAFEPDPVNFAILKKNVEDNHLTNVVLENRAIGDKNGKVKLFLNSENRGDHRILDKGDNLPSIEVDCVTLDSYFKGKKLDLIKMDVQGAEVLALKNQSLPDKVLVEVDPENEKTIGNIFAGYKEIFSKDWNHLYEK